MYRPGRKRIFYTFTALKNAYRGTSFPTFREYVEVR